jgi:hypothetical protein
MLAVSVSIKNKEKIMNMRSELDNLLQKPMDRKDFLKHVGLGIVALTGVATILKTLNGVNAPKRSSGYGSSAYGGSPKV